VNPQPSDRPQTSYHSFCRRAIRGLIPCPPQPGPVGPAVIALIRMDRAGAGAPSPSRRPDRRNVPHAGLERRWSWSKTPALAHSVSRRQQVTVEPQPSSRAGSSRHGVEVRAMYTMAARHARSGMVRWRSPSGGRGGAGSRAPPAPSAHPIRGRGQGSSWRGILPDQPQRSDTTSHALVRPSASLKAGIAAAGPARSLLSTALRSAASAAETRLAGAGRAGRGDRLGQGVQSAGHLVGQAPGGRRSGPASRPRPWPRPGTMRRASADRRRRRRRLARRRPERSTRAAGARRRRRWARPARRLPGRRRLHRRRTRRSRGRRSSTRWRRPCRAR
jgi:hypothetical protein